MACAQTECSGKTGGFLFPVLHQMLIEIDARTEPEARIGRAEPRCLILAPTRELATQIVREAQKFCAEQRACTPWSSTAAHEISLRRSRRSSAATSLLVATPGRLCDLIERGKISLAKIKFLVLDEADRMLDMGFEPQIHASSRRWPDAEVAEDEAAGGGGGGGRGGGFGAEVGFGGEEDTAAEEDTAGGAGGYGRRRRIRARAADTGHRRGWADRRPLAADTSAADTAADGPDRGGGRRLLPAGAFTDRRAATRSP